MGPAHNGRQQPLSHQAIGHGQAWISLPVDHQLGTKGQNKIDARGQKPESGLPPTLDRSIKRQRKDRIANEGGP